MLSGKTIVLGVTGSIAAYKIANLVRMIKKLGGNVHVMMTKNAENFINPITFETLSQNKCLVDTFDRNFQYSVEHVAIAKQADVVMIAPASANVIGKIANGIADDMLTTTVMACPCTKIIAPAMNHNMYHNPIVQDNIDKLRGYGYIIAEPERGMLANGDTGDGRMIEESELLEYILREVSDKDLASKRVLITAGATMESIDPVRYITNRSTGRMGMALARAAALRGADVTVIKGHTEVGTPYFVNVIETESAEDMYNAVIYNAQDFDIIIKAAAVADFTPASVADEKIKKTDSASSIELCRTKDILKALGESRKDGQFICGFSMETQNLIENSKDKLKKKNIDMICANSLKTEGAGFGCDTNVVTVITKDCEKPLPKLSKFECANAILDEIVKGVDSL